MDSFRGKTQHTLDPKGRLIIPARFRAVIKDSCQESLMLTTYAGAVYAYTMEEWDVVETELKGARGPDVADAKRLIIGSAMPCNLDKQGRILIPKDHREYAGIDTDSEVTLIGIVEHFEIWQTARLQKINEAFEARRQNGETAESLSKLGF